VPLVRWNSMRASAGHRPDLPGALTPFTSTKIGGSLSTIRWGRGLVAQCDRARLFVVLHATTTKNFETAFELQFNCEERISAFFMSTCRAVSIQGWT
jgi:hypothetical protein